MIDCHTHILPGVDDGPQTLKESVEMVRMGVAEGITHMIATPHYAPLRYDQSAVGQACSDLRAALAEEGLSMELTLGNELALDEETMKDLREGLCLPLGDSGHVLVELPYHKIYPVHEQWLYQLGIMGFTPVLAHVDRYPYLMADPQMLRRLMSVGCVSQMNASAILRRETRSPALKMIRNELVHLIASDCHSLVNRPPALREAFELVAGEVGPKMAEDLFTENPLRMLGKAPVVRQWPGMAAEKNGWRKWLGFKK